jgi:hypothetical protein
MQAGYSQIVHRQNQGIPFFARLLGLALAMTRIILILAVAIMIGPSLAYGSPACLTQNEALAKFLEATHLYMRNNCWSDSAVAPAPSPQRPSRAAAHAPPRPALAAAPVPSPRPKTVSSSIDAGAQCQYSPCE